MAPLSTLLLAALLTGTVFAQATRAPKFRADANVVLVPVDAVDSKNRPVTGLQRENFRVFDNGLEQNISSFLIEDQPVAVGLVFDTSGSMKEGLARSRMAARAFLETANPADEFLLVECNERASLTVPLTRDPGQIEDRMMFAQPKGRTALLDAIYLGIREVKRSSLGRKALLVVSDGRDNNSRYTQTELTRIPEHRSQQRWQPEGGH